MILNYSSMPWNITAHTSTQRALDVHQGNPEAVLITCSFINTRNYSTLISVEYTHFLKGIREKTKGSLAKKEGKKSLDFWRGVKLST